jgi:hypothetical protein
VFSVVYVSAVVYRAIVFRVGPGFPTAAAAVAITAVWLDILQLTHGSVYLRLAVIAAVAVVLVINAAIILAALFSARAFSFGRLGLTVFFALILQERLSNTIASIGNRSNRS